MHGNEKIAIENSLRPGERLIVEFDRENLNILRVFIYEDGTAYCHVYDEPYEEFSYSEQRFREALSNRSNISTTVIKKLIEIIEKNLS